MTSLCFLTFTFWNNYVLKLLCLETITFSDATLSDINIVLCYDLSQDRWKFAKLPYIKINFFKTLIALKVNVFDLDLNFLD